ncbi:MAG: putative sulfate exporter family transporter [Bacteroidetes bacterium]|nr:putative sulfate exporter family transporter [Bacteroidota bacterium]
MKEFDNIPTLYKKVIFIALLLACLTPWIDPPLALLIGVVVAQTIGHPYLSLNSKATNWLLKTSVVGLGFGMNLTHAMQAGKEGLLFTVLSIVSALLFGYLLSKWLKVDAKTSYLISAGTAICGGSAIAAVSPIIKADEKQMSVALGAVFILNSVALLVFPYIGHYFDMSQYQFGLWSAIAIHDTSSVVGAASKYGAEALQVATTVKLERALWIIPLSIGTAIFVKGDNKKIKIPYFIGMFIVTMCISTYLPQGKDFYEMLVFLARKGLTITLFLIGAGLSMKNIKSVGVNTLLLSVLLWIFISTLSIVVILGSGL